MAAVDLRQELCCSICTEIYAEPVTLSCGHSFCTYCINRTWDFREDREKTCPECNHRFWRRPQVKRNLKLHNIAEAFRHQQQMEEVQEIQRGDLRDVLKTLSSRKETYSKIVQTLVDRIRHLQNKKEEISKMIGTLFKKIQEQMSTLEQKVLGTIYSWYQQATQPVQDLIMKVEKTKDELYKKIQHHIYEMSNTEPGTEDYSGTIERPTRDTETPGEGAGDLGLALIAEILHTGLSDIIEGIYIEEPTNIYLDVKALCVPTSYNLESSCQALNNCSIPQTSRSLHPHPYNMKLHNIAKAFSQLVEAQEIQGGELREVLKTLFSQTENCSKILQTLEGERRELQKNADGISKKIRTLFIDIDKYIKILEKRVMSAISSWYDQVTIPVYDLIIKLEMKKDELDKKIQHHIDGMSNMEPGMRDFRDTMERPIGDTKTPGEGAGDLELALIAEILRTGLSAIITGIYIEEPTNIYLDVNAPHIPTSDDLESSSGMPGHYNVPETSRRLQLHPQTLNTSVISSGQHAWKVESSDSGVWRFGVYYFSMHGTGGQFSIGDNEKSWCLRRYRSQYEAMHDRNITQIPNVSSTNRLRMDLDYEAGQLSFHELSDPIRHLHTFTATFSEPLHAAFYVWRNTNDKCFWMDIVQL